MVPVDYFLYVSTVIFVLGIVGVILHRKNLILLLMCVELMLLAVNTNFIAFAESSSEILGEIFVFFILTVAASEAAIGLAIVVLLYRHHKTIDVQDIHELRG